MFNSPKRSGSKMHGRIIEITHEDGKVEAHMLPASGMHRDLSKASVRFEQYEGECLCKNWRAYVLRHFKQMKLLRGVKLGYLGFVRWAYGSMR